MKTAAAKPTSLDISDPKLWMIGLAAGALIGAALIMRGPELIAGPQTVGPQMQVDGVFLP